MVTNTKRLFKSTAQCPLAKRAAKSRRVVVRCFTMDFHNAALSATNNASMRFNEPVGPINSTNTPSNRTVGNLY
jgi:hypothetical protein